jgi:APA family basic amino acid/polyamine antiporter
VKPARTDLVRAITRTDLTASVVNSVVGSSIFGMPATIAALSGVWSPLVYVVAGTAILTIVFCFSEVASRFDRPGGVYLYAREAFGGFVGFQAGWLSFWIRVTSVAANLNVFVDYLAQIVPRAGAGIGRAVVMVVVLAIVTAVNVAGVKRAAWTVDFFVIAKLLPLGFLVLLALPRISREVLASQAVAHPDWRQAVLLLIFAFGGFESALVPASEAKNPRKDSAFALLAGLLAIGVVYTLVQLAVVGIVPHVGAEKAPIAAAMAVVLGPAGIAFASIAAMVSVYGWATGALLTSPRTLYSMAEEGDLSPFFGRVHERFRTPYVAILLFAAASLAFSLFGSFASNAVLSAIVRLVTYALVAVAVLRLRQKWPDRAPAFRLPLAPLVVTLAFGFCAYMLWTRPLRQAWMLLVMLAIGTVLFADRTRRLPPRATGG